MTGKLGKIIPNDFSSLSFLFFKSVEHCHGTDFWDIDNITKSLKWKLWVSHFSSQDFQVLFFLSLLSLNGHRSWFSLSYWLGFDCSDCLVLCASFSSNLPRSTKDICGWMKVCTCTSAGTRLKHNASWKLFYLMQNIP